MEKGLAQEEIQNLRAQYGENEIITKKPTSPLVLFLSNLPNLLNGVLALAAIFSFVIGDLLDSFFIFAVIIINAVFEFVQEYKAEKSIEKLKTLIKPLARVIRNGIEKQIESKNLVPGDIVVLSEGDRIQADGILVKNEDIEIDESILTGESLPVAKGENDEVYSGTLVTKGKGIFKVTKIGLLTKIGNISKTLSTTTADKTPLQKRLDSLGKIISVIAIVIAFSIIPISIAQGKELFPILLLAISISVAAVPQSLPAIITISLAIGTNRMAKKHAIVRKMPAVETLGSVQYLLVDKTGTLTQNDMRVKDVYLLQKNHETSLLRACVFGNTASLAKKGGKDFYEIIGDKTDGALLLYAQNKVKSLSLLKDGGKITDEFVFDPEEKTITTVWQEGGKRYVYVRGAPEAVLEKSRLSEKERESATLEYEKFAKQGLRVIGFAVKEEAPEKETERKELENNLTFLGFIGIYDPPRPEVKEAVLKSQAAGIQTIMVTGDNELTALTIAKEVGLITKDEEVITGQELSKMTDEELKKILPNIRVFARAQPEDKLRITNVLKDLGFIVGVTGDGVNDALALKRADVGVAMGLSGTDVAKEAADIVITDDNYTTIIHAIEEGRRIYDNILKSVMYLLSGNLAELSLVFFASVAGLPNPLLPTQILWINLVTDGLPALALAADHKDPDLLKRKPRDPKAPILTKNRIVFIGVVGFGISQFLIILFSFLLNSNSEVFSRTVVFNTLIFLHLMIAFAVRGKSMLRPNKLLVLSVVLTLFIQVAITTIPAFRTLFGLGF